MGWLSGWPPLEASQNDMHPETVRVFEWCLVAAEQARGTEDTSRLLLDIGAELVNELLREQQRGG